MRIIKNYYRLSYLDTKKERLQGPIRIQDDIPDDAAEYIAQANAGKAQTEA